VKELHPTPAVGGVPSTISCKYIKEYEGYDRSLYSGYIGIVDFNTNNAEYFVNLRCFKAYQNYIKLYAGAGITKDSVAEKEYDETENKMQSILSKLVLNDK
jgi:isochorismate synthase